jgi:kynurenine formamidase
MCSTKVVSLVEAETTRRRFLRSVGAAAVGVGAAAVGVRAESQSNGSWRVGTTVQFERVVDLTHVLQPNIPNYFRLNMEITPLLTIEQHGVFVNRLTVPENYGTHFDTPAHFIRRGTTGESIEPERLVGPLVIIDIAERASWDPNAEVTMADLEQWERQNWIPPGASVAMYFNWAKRWPTAAYLNEDDAGTYNFSRLRR